MRSANKIGREIVRLRAMQSTGVKLHLLLVLLDSRSPSAERPGGVSARIGVRTARSLHLYCHRVGMSVLTLDDAGRPRAYGMCRCAGQLPARAQTGRLGVDFRIRRRSACLGRCLDDSLMAFLRIVS